MAILLALIAVMLVAPATYFILCDDDYECACRWFKLAILAWLSAIGLHLLGGCHLHLHYKDQNYRDVQETRNVKEVEAPQDEADEIVSGLVDRPRAR